MLSVGVSQLHLVITYKTLLPRWLYTRISFGSRSQVLALQSRLKPDNRHLQYIKSILIPEYLTHEAKPQIMRKLIFRKDNIYV